MQPSFGSDNAVMMICPACDGNILPGKDRDGAFLQCIQCARFYNHSDMPKEPPKKHIDCNQRRTNGGHHNLTNNDREVLSHESTVDSAAYGPRSGQGSG